MNLCYEYAMKKQEEKEESKRIREANQKAGYVYIISNIGSFGKDIYKIGMTRRLEPTDRVDELGDASVPFAFDIHAMIFSDDAPALEAALHRAFDSKKVNMVNTRREFFHVTLEEIEEVVRKNYDKTVEFVKPPASNPKPATPSQQPKQKRIYSPEEMLHTKWGTYEIPQPYTISFVKGPRHDLKKITD